MADERIAAEKETLLTSLREKEARIFRAIRESRDIEARLLLKGRGQEAATQQGRTAELARNRQRLRTEIHELSCLPSQKASGG